MNSMQMKTPEERKVIAAKGCATKRRKREELETLKRNAVNNAFRLKNDIDQLERKLATLEHTHVISTAAALLTGKYLLREEQIVDAASPWKTMIGVYFLVKDKRVVYVGQSVNVFSRIAEHKEKNFDSYAFISCEPDSLDLLESLYIHLLRPALNGNLPNGGKFAPLAFEALIKVI